MKENLPSKRFSFRPKAGSSPLLCEEEHVPSEWRVGRCFEFSIFMKSCKASTIWCTITATLATPTAAPANEIFLKFINVVLLKK